MDTMGYDLTELSRAECLSLLASAPFGRVIFTEGALPAVRPVNFVLDPLGIVIHTSPDSAVWRTAAPAVVAFEVDDLNAVSRSGWSVTVIGRAVQVRDALTHDRLSATVPPSWTSRPLTEFVVIELGMISGRRIGAPVSIHPEVSSC